MIGELASAVSRGLTRTAAFTGPGAGDPRLRGRTYAIPFDDVWRAALELVDSGLKRWELLEADDQDGVIRGIAHSRIERLTSAITVRISLDLNAQTRVDALSALRVGRADLGVNARRLGRFFRELDKRLARDRDTPIEDLRLEPGPPTPMGGAERASG